jgi:hypothetical protein
MADPENSATHVNALCANCQTPLHGKFCAKCGQNQRGMDRFFLSLVAEAFDNIFSLDSRTARTLLALLFKPGFLTSEYFAGRRARYIQPLRLYFIASLLFFLFLSVQNMLSEPMLLDIYDEDALTQDQQTEPELVQSTTEVTAEEVTADIQIDQLADEQKRKISESANDQQTELEQVSAAINEGTSELHFDSLTDEQNQQLSERLKRQLTKAATMGLEDPRTLVSIAIDIAPPVLLILLPFFAMALKLAYIGSRRYYTEHLILAVHNHCFVYLILLVANAIEPIEAMYGNAFFSITLLCWMPLYMYLSLKKVYHQGYWLTAVKFLGLGVAYLALFFTAFLSSLLAGVLIL